MTEQKESNKNTLEMVNGLTEIADFKIGRAHV